MWCDLPHDVMAAELQHTTQSVADDGGTQVTYMHFLGDVGRGEIYQNLFTRHGRGSHAVSDDAQRGVHQQIAADGDVDEAIRSHRALGEDGTMVSIYDWVYIRIDCYATLCCVC